MTSISSLLSNNFSWLNRQNNSTDETGDAAAIAALGGNSGSSGSQGSNSYLLDLSPEAQAYLSKSGLLGNGNASGSSGEDSFTLTAQQQKKLNEIIAKYKDVPMDENSYAQLAKELKSAGISPEQLSAQEQINSINPTGMLLDALNGIDNTQAIAAKPEELKKKADNYLKSILQQWQDISTIDVTTAANDGSSTTQA